MALQRGNRKKRCRTCSCPRWCMKTGADAKKVASDAASINSCSASVFEPMICRGRSGG